MHYDKEFRCEEATSAVGPSATHRRWRIEWGTTNLTPPPCWTGRGVVSACNANAMQTRTLPSGFSKKSYRLSMITLTTPFPSDWQIVWQGRSTITSTGHLSIVMRTIELA